MSPKQFTLQSQDFSGAVDDVDYQSTPTPMKTLSIFTPKGACAPKRHQLPRGPPRHLVCGATGSKSPPQSILKLYPELDLEKLRIAILLGADTTNRLPAKSKGRLDEEKAFELAQKMALWKAGETHYNDLIRSSFRGHELRALKMQIVKSL